jgi:hypothetical protein
MTLTLWDQFFVLWEESNAVVPGADSSEQMQMQCRKARILLELHRLHALQLEVLPCDLIFFISTTPADDAKIDLFVQSHGPNFIPNWIYTYRPLFLKSQRDALHASTRGVRSITQAALPSKYLLLLILGPLVLGPVLLPTAGSLQRPTSGHGFPLTLPELNTFSFDLYFHPVTTGVGSTDSRFSTCH